MTLDERWEQVDRKPAGFDYLRIVLAACVLLWHSYQMSYGTVAAKDFWSTSYLGWILQLILPIFFGLSGYLVSSSMYRNPDLRVFLWLRFIRIFPALVVEVALSALVLGPLFTSATMREYFFSAQFIKYCANIVGWIHYTLPGVFLENPLPAIVNSSLWTIPFELECYVLISALALIGMFSNKRLVIPCFIAATIVVYLWNYFASVPGIAPGAVNGRVLVLCFFGGIVVYAYRAVLPWRIDLALASLVVAAVLIRQGETVYLAPIFTAYSTAIVGMLNPRRSIIVNSGDYSYGTYLYAGPMQQTAAAILGTSVSWISNVAIALPLTVCFALFSWWFVEKPFLRLRGYVQAKPVKVPARLDDFSSSYSG